MAGYGQAELVIADVQVVDLAQSRVYPADVLIQGERFVGVVPAGTGQAEQRIEGRGRYLAPGLVNAHVHSESSLVTLTEWAKLILAKGTTSVILNPHEIANVLGLRGIELLLQQIHALPLRVFISAPCKVPTEPALETSGARFDVPELEAMAAWPQVVAAGEFDGRRIITQDERQVRLLKTAQRLGLRIDGHLIGLTPEESVAAHRAGIQSNHEAVDPLVAAAQAQAGLMVMIREGSSARNLNLVRAVLEQSPQDQAKFCFCTDDKDPLDIAREGDINWNVNQAIRLGLSPLVALRLASLNTAEHFGLGLLGRVCPGAPADCILFSDLHRVEPEATISRGRVVAVEGRMCCELAPEQWPAWARDTVRSAELPVEALSVPGLGPEATVKLIEVMPGQITTRLLSARLRVRDGQVQPDPDADILKLAVVERHQRSGRCQAGFVRGFGLKQGAIASTVAHDHHHMVGVGASDTELHFAFTILRRLGGGMVVVREQTVLASLPLPLAGLLSDQPLSAVQAQSKSLEDAARSLGSRLPSTFGLLSFISLPTVPEAGFSDLGLVDVRRRCLCPVVESD